MSKKELISEIVIKGIYFIFSIIASIFVVKNIISFASLYQANSVDEQTLYQIIGKTQIGKIFADLNGVFVIDSTVIIKTLTSFLKNIEVICIVFLVLTLALLLLYFIFTNWSLVASYLKLSAISIVLYLLKYVLFGLSVLIFFKDSYTSIIVALNLGTTLYLLISAAQLFFFSLWIIKFIFNILLDLKSYIQY